MRNTSLPPGRPYLSNTVIREGESLGLIYGFETDGVFRSQAEIDYYESLEPRTINIKSNILTGKPFPEI